MTWSRQRTAVICAVLFGVLLAGCDPAATEEPLPVDPQVVTVAPTADAPTAATVAPGLPQLDAGTAIPVPATPTATPSPTATPLIKGVYAVTPGDTLIGIALQFDVTVDDLIRVNELTNPNLLAVGQQLRIPGEEQEPATDLGPALEGTGTLFVCPETSRVYTLNLPFEAIQLQARGDSLFLVAGGRFYGLLLEDLGRSPMVTPADLMPPDDRVDGIGIQELVYLTRDPVTDDFYLLDKSNDLYRYDAAGQWHVEVAARQIPGIFPDPQYLALAVYDGVVYILDADLGRIWRVTRDDEWPEAHFLGSEVGVGIDLAMPADAAGTEFFMLARDGSLATLELHDGLAGVGRPDVAPLAWPAQVAMRGTQLMLVDGQTRRVTVHDLPSLETVRTFQFRYPGMPRLRNAALVGSALFAVGGPYLYAAPFAGLTETCPQVTFDDRVLYQGVDVATLFPQVDLPFAVADLPPRPRSYPGARRLYRHGVHEGLDMYALDVPGLTVGTPVGVIADGTVARANHDYVEMTPAEYDAAEEQTRLEHRTNEELADIFLGRQVRVEHSAAVTSVYAHLSDIAPAIVPGRTVFMHATLGEVGVSGTSSGAYDTNDGVHLHFEIWVDGHYLGEGLSIDETMRIYAALFGDRPAE